jgi:hypothetical protein
MRLGELLIREKLITAEALEEALESQVVHGGRLGTNLVELGLLAETDLARMLGKLHNCAHASGEMVPDPKALEQVDLNEADQLDYLPMRMDATRLSLAVLNPHDYATLDALAFKTGKRVVPVIIPEFRMNQLQRRYTKSFRPLRAIDMNVVRPSRKAQEAEKAEKLAASPDLMSEEEFQSVYAQALTGGTAPEAPDEELELIVLEEEMEVEVLAPAPTPPAAARPAAPPPQVPQQPVMPPRAPVPPPAAPQAPVAPRAPVAPPPRAPMPVPPAQQVPRAPVPVPPPVAMPPQARPTMSMGVVQPSAPVPPPAQPPRPVAPAAVAPPPAPPPRPLTFAEAQAELARVSDREDVATAVLRFALGKWKRSLLLSVQGSLVTGWRGIGSGVHEAAVRRIGIALRDQSTFRLVRDTRSHYVGPVRRDAAMELFYKLLGAGFPKTAVILPLLVRGKVVHLLYVDNGPEQFTTPDVGELIILAQSVGRSYEAMINRRKSA